MKLTIKLFSAFLVLLALVGSLTGCGLKGPLYRPENALIQTTPTITVSIQSDFFMKTA